MLHPDPETYLKQQEEMLLEQHILPNTIPFPLTEDSILLTLDVQYEGEWGFVALDCLTWGIQTQQLYLSREKISVDYVPGFFAFREGPLLVAAVKRLMNQAKIVPSLLIIDGHGTAHPRRMGLASWVGIKLALPTIGLAKRSLLKVEVELATEACAAAKVILDEEEVGFVLRTQTGVKPVFVSAGHLISQSAALEVVKSLRGPYRIIVPMRRADHAARQFAKGEIVSGGIVLT